MTRPDRMKFFQRQLFVANKDLRFGLQQDGLVKGVPFFFFLGALCAPEETGIFVSVKPTPTIRATTQKVILAQRLRFGHGASLWIGGVEC